ncbi:unnamed protein product, partial [Gongylonema pulchrum]|uniref:DUF4806 domain-containing protein n=1 Tax=Gongylonema pulchrum TaxID=637853 RepID=A0A183E8J6_9BILA
APILSQPHLIAEDSRTHFFSSIPLDEPSCSEDSPSTPVQDDIGVLGTRRVRSSTATSRRSLFFGKDKTEMLARLTLLKDEVQKPVPMFELEMHWTSIVRNNLLKQMNELYQCLLKMQEAGYMRDVDPRRVFLNYPELYVHNSKFWKK